KQKFGTRWIHTHHNWYYPEFGRNGLEPWQEQFNEWFLVAAAEADVCLCVSRSQQRFLREQFDLNCSYLPNGVDIQACRKADAGRWQQTTGIAPGFVLFVGRNERLSPTRIDFPTLNCRRCRVTTDKCSCHSFEKSE
ncbi:MAG: glycosyltransferase, partial [Planctomycetaceae bacterium]